MNFFTQLQQVLSTKKILSSSKAADFIQLAVDRREVLVTRSGALATWTPVESTGRSPKDTYIVRFQSIEKNIDWQSPNNLPLDPATYEMLQEDTLKIISQKDELLITERVVGADPAYALPVRTITDRAVSALFSLTMFRPIPEKIENSIFYNTPFTVIVLPNDKLDKKRYFNKVRQLPDNTPSDLIVAMDFVNRLGIIIGSSYLGSLKKLIFTVMNYLLPEKGILPLHTSANEDANGNVALFLGLSGTGKTTLSADPERLLLGDDEHGWSENGIANFENGCYAKLINLNPDKEPDIYNAIMHQAHYLEHGSIIENAMVYPDGTVDFNDKRFTENSRGSYPLTALSKIKPSACGGHPKHIIFLTADANGVLPPVAKLNYHQTMLWFLMGYTSKLAGTETGIVEPVSTFSRFFGQPFMPRNPDDYTSLLKEKIKKHNCQVWLVNTGWSGGPYGIGKRIDIAITRKIISAILSGMLDNTETKYDPLFHLNIPLSCPQVPTDILFPENNWQDKAAFRIRAEKLAQEFSQNFDKYYSNKNLPQEIRQSCPGK